MISTLIILEKVKLLIKFRDGKRQKSSLTIRDDKIRDQFNFFVSNFVGNSTFSNI